MRAQNEGGIQCACVCLVFPTMWTIMCETWSTDFESMSICAAFGCSPPRPCLSRDGWTCMKFIWNDFVCCALLKWKAWVMQCVHVCNISSRLYQCWFGTSRDSHVVLELTVCGVCMVHCMLIFMPWRWCVVDAYCFYAWPHRCMTGERVLHVRC